jgi:putative transcriptional regulator
MGLSAKKRKAGKPNAAAKAVGTAMLADLAAFAKALESGTALESKYTVRRVEVPDSPRTYSAREVRATRDKIAVSQSIFAQLLGVSTILVQAWEQGHRTPAPWARRLLDEVNHDPKRWRGMVKKAS